MAIVAVPLLSVAVGGSKVQGVPCWAVLLVLPQVITGAVVSVTVTFWLHVLLLPQPSVACQVRVALKVLPQPALVIVLETLRLTFVLPPLSVTIGSLNTQAFPHWTVRLVLLQIITGAVVSLTVTFWLHVL